MPYIWKLYTKDGSEIIEGNDKYKSSADVPAEDVVRVEYLPLGKGSSVSLDIDLESGERFFRFWRRTQSIGDNFTATGTVYVMGKEKDGVKLLSIYLYPDGDVVVSHYHELD